MRATKTKKGPGASARPTRLSPQFAGLRGMLARASQKTPSDAAKPAGNREPEANATVKPRPSKPPAPAIDPDDQTLFRRAMKSVQPIKDTRRAILPPIAQAPSAILRGRRERAVGVDRQALAQVSDQYAPANVDGNDASFVRHGHGPDLIKGLKRGKWLIGATLDLHGNTLEEARDRLDRFLSSCLTHHIKCVRIVHGKGYGSKDGEPVLKQTVRRWLSQMADVLAYTECAEHDGGSGAVQVLLRGDGA